MRTGHAAKQSQSQSDANVPTPHTSSPSGSLPKCFTSTHNRLVGLSVKATALRVADLDWHPVFGCGSFSWSSHASDLKTCSPVATPPGAQSYSVSARTSQPCVSIYDWVPHNRLVGLAVKATALRVADLDWIPAFCCGSFSWSSHASDLKTCSPVVTLPGAQSYSVSARTSQPSVSIYDWVR